MGKQCKSCGSYVPSDANFCQVCGGPLPPSECPAVHDHQLPRFTGECSRKEFIEKFADPPLKKSITGIAVLCYVCAGVTFVTSCLANPWGIIDALVLASFALGMHLAKSNMCAILILILSIVEVLLSLSGIEPLTSPAGSFPFWWLFAGISAVVTFAIIEKQYKEFLTCLDGRRRRPRNKNR